MHDNLERIAFYAEPGRTSVPRPGAWRAHRERPAMIVAREQQRRQRIGIGEEITVRGLDQVLMT
jgi:hypothetical protein